MDGGREEEEGDGFFFSLAPEVFFVFVFSPRINTDFISITSGWRRLGQAERESLPPRVRTQTQCR